MIRVFRKPYAYFNKESIYLSQSIKVICKFYICREPNNRKEKANISKLKMARKRNSLAGRGRGKASTSFRRQKILPLKSSRQFKQSRKLKKKAIRNVSDASFSLSYLTDSLVSTPVPGPSKKGKGRGKRSDKVGGSVSSVDSMLISGNVEVSKDTTVEVDSTVCQNIRDKFRNDHILGGSSNNRASDSVAGGASEVETIVIEDDEDDDTLTPSVVGNIMLNLLAPTDEEKNEGSTETVPEARNKTVELDDTSEDDVLILDEKNFPSLPGPSSTAPLTSSNLQQITSRYPSKAPNFIPLLSKISDRQRQMIFKNRVGKVKRLQPNAVSKKLKSNIRGTVSKATLEVGHSESSGGVIVASGPTMLSEAGARSSPAGGLRPIVIDGSNVAMNHGQRKVFSVKGIELVIRYFENRGHKKIIAFVPEFRKKFNQSSDQKLLERLEDEQRVSFTPSRTVDGVHITSYDDTFILDYAAQHGAIVVTRDQYRDLINQKPEWREVIEKRILMQTFVGDDLMFPHDPLGRGGPNLDTFLRY